MLRIWAAWSHCRLTFQSLATLLSQSSLRRGLPARAMLDGLRNSLAWGSPMAVLLGPWQHLSSHRIKLASQQYSPSFLAFSRANVHVCLGSSQAQPQARRQALQPSMHCTTWAAVIGRAGGLTQSGHWFCVCLILRVQPAAAQHSHCAARVCPCASPPLISQPGQSSCCSPWHELRKGSSDTHKL